MPCWMKYRIGLTERKNSKKKKKIMFHENILHWMKIWSRANFSSNIFRLIQHSFHVGLVYSLFHPKFYSYDVISNVRTSNFEWSNKTKTLCKIITIKKWHTSNRNSLNSRQEDSDHQSNSFKVLYILPKHFIKCASIFHIEFLYYVLERIQLLSPFYPLSRFTSAWLFIIRVYKLW